MIRKPTPYELALWAALPMAHTSRIEGRLKMILDHTRSRRALTRRALLLVLGFSAAVLVPLAALRPGARAQAAAPGAASRRLLETTPVLAAAPAAFASGGVPVQLVGIGSLKTLKWWGKNGAPSALPVYGISPFLSSGEFPYLRQRRVQLAFRLPPAAQDVTVKYILPNSLNSSSDGSWPFKMQGQKQWTEAQLNERTGGARIVTATYPGYVSKTNVRVGTASGPWTITAVNRDPEMGTSAATTLGTFIVGPAAETKNGITLSVAASEPKQDVRLVAVDAQGHDLLPTSIGDQSIGRLDQITAIFAGLSLSQIKQIRVETRPFRWVEFKDIALQPTK